jgi:hypothetical protein
VLSSGVLDVGNVEGAGVLLDVLQDATSANIVTTNGQNGSTIFELDKSINFTGFKVEL